MTGSSSRSWRREAPPNHSMAEGVGPETSLVIIGRPVHPFRRFLTSPGRSRGKCGTNPVSGLTLSARRLSSGRERAGDREGAACSHHGLHLAASQPPAGWIDWSPPGSSWKLAHQGTARCRRQRGGRHRQYERHVVRLRASGPPRDGPTWRFSRPLCGQRPRWLQAWRWSRTVPPALFSAPDEPSR